MAAEFDGFAELRALAELAAEMQESINRIVREAEDEGIRQLILTAKADTLDTSTTGARHT